MKKKLLALTMASAVMLMGAGYAAWTDNLQVNSTVKTGELNVEFQGPHEYGQDEYWASPRMFYLHKDAQVGEWNWASATANDLFTADVDYAPKTMTFTFENMYPGTRAAGKYTIENTGTIPAVINNVTVDVQTLDPGAGAAEVANAIRVNASGVKIIRDGAIIDSASINGVTLWQLESTLEDFFKGKRLQPNDKVILTGNGVESDAGEIGELAVSTFNFELPYDSLSGDQGELETVQINIGFDFIQHNMEGTLPTGG